MKLSAKIAAAVLLLGAAGPGAAYAAEAMCACCKDMKDGKSCCDEMKAGEKPAAPATPHQH